MHAACHLPQCLTDSAVIDAVFKRDSGPAACAEAVCVCGGHLHAMWELGSPVLTVYSIQQQTF
jgi:hypothetical protein